MPSFDEKAVTLEDSITRLTPENLKEFMSLDSAGLIRVGKWKIALSDDTMNAIREYSNSIRFATLNLEIFDTSVLREKGIKLRIPSVQMVQENRIFHVIDGPVKDNILEVNRILSINGTKKK